MPGQHRLRVGWLAVLVTMVIPLAYSQICERPPRWTVNGGNPMKGMLGNVAVVGLLEAS